MTVWALMAVIGGRAFGFDFLGAGALRVALFLLGCFLTALVIGLLVCSLVLLWGTRAETSAWAAVNFFVMLSGIYYPVSVLPDWVQTVSAGIPLNLVQKWLGHAQLTTTAIYADAVGAEEKDIARRMWGSF